MRDQLHRQFLHPHHQGRNGGDQCSGCERILGWRGLWWTICRRDRSLLSFHKGEIVTIISRDASGWWKGKIEDKVGQFPKDNVEVLILKPGSTGKDYAESPRAPSLKQRLMNGGLASSDESEQSGGVAKPTEMKGVARMNSRAYYQQLNSSGGLADTDTRTVYAPSSNVKRYPLAEYATKHFNIEERTKEEKINPTPGMTAADVLTTYSDSPLKARSKGVDEASVKIVIDTPCSSCSTWATILPRRPPTS